LSWNASQVEEHSGITMLASWSSLSADSAQILTAGK